MGTTAPSDPEGEDPAGTCGSPGEDPAGTCGGPGGTDAGWLPEPGDCDAGVTPGPDGEAGNGAVGAGQPGSGRPPDHSGGRPLGWGDQVGAAAGRVQVRVS